MSRPKNRLQLMNRLGAEQLNNVWSWCAVNEAEKKVYFSIWTDNIHTHNEPPRLSWRLPGLSQASAVAC